MADAMADSGGGVDWTVSLKPFLSSSFSTSLSKIELLDLCTTITKAETEILKPKANNKSFLNSFVVLASDYISKRTLNLSTSQLENVTAACRVLLKYLLNALQTICVDTSAHGVVIERYLNAIRILCTGTDLLSSSEVSSLLNAMKGENISPVNNPLPDGEKENCNKSENNKNRSDLSTSIFEQLTLPLHDDHTVILDPMAIKQPNPVEPSTSNDPSSEINRLFLKMNLENLQILRAGDTLVDLCLNLTSIKRAKVKVDEALAGKPFSLPCNHSEATVLRNGLATTLSEINLAISAISLPVLEPLTPTKLDKLIQLSMAILYLALSHAIANSLFSSSSAVSPKCPPMQAQTNLKEDETDVNAVNLIEQILHLHGFLGSTVKNSTRAGGHVYQNHVLAGAWVLVSGLHAYVNATTADKQQHLKERDDKARSPCKMRDAGAPRLGLFKFQHSFGVLLVALANKTLTLLSELFEDLQVEACSEPIQVEPAPLAAMGHFTALQRAARVLNAASLNQMLFYLALVSYGRAGILKRLRPPEGDTFSQSDSATYYEDMILCSDQSDIVSSSSTDEDDDSEPLLGLWFEKTLAPTEPSESKTPLVTENPDNKSAQTERSHTVVPEKGEPYGYISLAKSLFVFMNKYLLCSKSAYVARYVKTGLTEQQMIMLAGIIRDLDKETARTEVGTISVYFGPQLGQLYCDFSGALTRYTHNLITHSNLTALQTCLLNHLGVSPWNSEPWPLLVYPRTLSVLAQVLLLRPQNEKEASVISIWHRLVNTLIENMLNSHQGSTESDNEDLNVEHAQVLLYLFHSLNLMQKKSVVLLLAGGIMRCSELTRSHLKDMQLLHLSRLLLLFDYIMKHLYDAPASLLEQIQWNFFYSTSLNVDGNKENNMTRMYTPWQEIEDNYRKAMTSDEFSMKPRFYMLATLELNNQDLPKLDGLACNFILGTPDKLKYCYLLDSLIEILSITHVVTGTGSTKMSVLGLCASQYCFTICWRLLQLLPPSQNFMEAVHGTEIRQPKPFLLTTLVWGPRCAHKHYNQWLKDCLIKQGMYTQHADKLVKQMDTITNNFINDAKNAKHCMLVLTPDVKQGIIKKETFPPIFSLMILDVLLAKIQLSVQEPEIIIDGSPISYPLLEERQDLLPHVIKLTQYILQCTRWSILHAIKDQNENSDKERKVTLQSLECLQDILAITSSKNTLTNTLSTELKPLLPSSVTSVQQEWNNLSLECPSPGFYQKDIVPSENYLLKIVDIHISSLSRPPFNINLSLKRLIKSCVSFICEFAPKIENTDTKNKAIATLVACTLDLQTEFLHDRVSATLDKLIGDSETDEHQKRIYLHVLHHTYKLITEYTTEGSLSHEQIDEKILHYCLKFYEKIIEKSSGRQALETFFTGDKDLVKVLLSVANPKMSQQYSTRVLHFFNKMFQAAEKSSTDPSLNYLCGSMSKLAEVDSDRLQSWLKQVIIGSNLDAPPSKADQSLKSSTKNTKASESPALQNTSPEDIKSIVQENSQLLQALTLFIVNKNSNITEDAAITILKALLPLGSYILSPVLDGIGFADLMVVMNMLADGSTGKGHSHLFPVAFEWIALLNEYFNQTDVIDKLSSETEFIKNSTMVDAACCILDYISEVVVKVMSLRGNLRPLSPALESEVNIDLDSDWQEENEDDESGVDSDEDSLCNKLCTFTITQKEFMNQHWYHCHTCRMLDGVGVCSVCARVCHKGHDLSYAKYGNFFCDCGAKEDGTCQALTKRNPLASGTESAGAENKLQTALTNLEKISNEMMHQNSTKKRSSSPIAIDRMTVKKKWSNSVRHLEGSLEWIIGYLENDIVIKNLIDFVQLLLPSVENVCKSNSAVGCHTRALAALTQLHSEVKQYQHTDQLMTPTLGSQEGAFENVRISYSGEQGQTIRQLLSAHILRRVAMCCMSSPYGRRQHLAVSHEKGKITVLQLSALLKQADSATRKLTLTRLSSAPVPFTVISMTSNLCNDDFLAVCGLKDCHVLTFSLTGSVTDHLVLQPQLETGNFIIKALWLPGSQTKLALITADFVKIYDLAVDALSPQYYFLVASGKIRDCTFVYSDGVYQILLMSSPGYIYSEFLDEGSSAKHGSFYMTNTLEVFHLDVTDVSGQIAGGGVSIYYSHKMGLLFYSYVQGKSFISPYSLKNNCLTVVIPVTLSNASNNSSTKSNSSRNNTPQPLCQWTEIPNHPGLVCCATQSSNNPVVLMLKPDTILIQEIRVVPSKSKIMDMVAIRHSSTEPRTTLMLLCEDGSLKMFMANMEQTGFWMTPNIQSSSASLTLKPKKKKTTKSKASHSSTFPVDFFEHCQPMNDVEIGGNDLLQVYNAAQLKHRLNTMNLYVACNKPVGFTINVTNNDSNMVMTGLRVLVGSQEVQRAPSFIEIFGRIIPLTVTRSRWFDIPFSREESLFSDKNLTIMFGPSQDPENITMVDSIKIFGRSKESFGWPEENEDVSNSSGNQQNNFANSEAPTGSNNLLPATKLERVIVGVLEALDGTFMLHLNDEKLSSYKPLVLKVATDLLILPMTPFMQINSKALLSSLHPNKPQYHSYKDQALLQHVVTTLNAMTDEFAKDPSTIDAESYYRLVLIVKNVAVSRPQNLVKFADSHTSIQDVVLDDPLEVKPPKTKDPKKQHLLLQLMDVLWTLHSLNPEKPQLASVVVPGLKHTEQIVHGLVEIVHAFNSCDTYSNITIAVYLQLLLCRDPVIAFSAKQALTRVLKPNKKRKGFAATPPRCTTPRAKLPQQSQLQISFANRNEEASQSVDSIAVLQQAGTVDMDNEDINPLEALLSGAAGFQPLIEIPPDADDEAMVELAIALSLQDHEMVGEHGQLPDLQALANGALVQEVQNVQRNEAGHFSDTTASGVGSDDEGSTAATDGSTLRTSPAEQGGSAGSESGGSGVESITGEHNASDRSSACGDNNPEGVSKATTSSVSTSNYQPNVENENLTQGVDLDADPEGNSRLHILRLQLLERLIEYLPKLKDVGGTRSVPFLQIVLLLTSELNCNSDRDKVCLDSLLGAIVHEIHLNSDCENFITRDCHKEVQLVLMRLLSVLMSRCKSGSQSSSSKCTSGDSLHYISQRTAAILHKSNIVTYCGKIIQSLVDYWKNYEGEVSVPAPQGGLLKENLPHTPPDMTPFFMKQFVKEHYIDIFCNYPHLVTDMALRLPYQIYKHYEITDPITSIFDNNWYRNLCEYMMVTQAPLVRRQVRKLLLFICGSKEKYRQLRDYHTLTTHVKGIKQCCVNGGYQPSSANAGQFSLSLTYDALVELMEHLKACLEVAVSRTGNWQRFCIRNTDILPYLLEVSVVLDEHVASTVLHLVQCAIVIAVANRKSNEVNKGLTSLRRERDKPEEYGSEALFEETSCKILVENLHKYLIVDTFTRFIKAFLLESNVTHVRWQAHSLILSIYRNSKAFQQESLLKLLWQLWPLLPLYGKKAIQFVDLLGYFSLEFVQTKEGATSAAEYVQKVVSVLTFQNQSLRLHPNSNLYAQLAQYVELDGYYLESDPCLVCNNPEIPFSTIKLNSIKLDSKFTTTTQIVKLLGSYTISRITLKIGDLKRSKMVRTINIYYNNRNVQGVVELKNKPSLWHKAKSVVLSSGQNEVKIEFALPIVACNFMIEYSDFYENLQASTETLQCPRCSAAVPANPGVCGTCGENVFQCHKCRAINYDEKDPFLCHSCGFCKYAKFDFALLAKPCFAVEPIENDEDQKKMVSSINTLIDKTDRVYKQLIANKPTLENLLQKVTDQRTDKRNDDVPVNNSAGGVTSTITVPAGTAQIKVNKAIQSLAQQYCNECKLSFEELSRNLQKILVSRKELVLYDRKNFHLDLPVSDAVTEKGSLQTIELVAQSIGLTTTKCYGCCSATIEHCLTLLRALSTNSVTREILSTGQLIQELICNNLRKGSPQIQEEVRQLLSVLTTNNLEASEELCALLEEKFIMAFSSNMNSIEFKSSIKHEIELLSNLVQKEDSTWELKLKCMIRLFMQASNFQEDPIIMESVILPCLKIFHNLMKPPETGSKKNKEKANNTSKQVSSKITVDVNRWLQDNQEQSFAAWQKLSSEKHETQSLPPNLTAKEVKEYYLQERYFEKWKNYIKCKKNPLLFNNLLYAKRWLKTVLFTPVSRLARQMTCSILKLLCNNTERKKQILILMTGFLPELGVAGESSAEFLTLYHILMQETPWKQYLTNQGLLITLANLINAQIEKLLVLENTTLTSDITEGYALNQLTDLMSTLLDDSAIRRQYKRRLVGDVLNGYLCLKRLVVQRTRLIDVTQEKLLELLEEMTTGTQKETKAFMAVCIKTVETCSPLDILTPVFIFERLCSIIYPEESDITEFFLTLEKDPQQEDFLQGRMLGNPYSCLEAGMGPLMRDVKNKICQDCELVALLEDDNGMELLVNNKIISLDLAVRDVYKKIWLEEGGDHDAMRVVYRMRGLLGDATEEFIETLDNKSKGAVNNEEVYKMANVLAKENGLKVMVNRLGAVQNVTRAKPLVQVLLKLFRLSIKVSKCREVLIQPEIGAMKVFLRTLKLCLEVENSDASHNEIVEQLVEIMRTILSRATSKPMETYMEFSRTFGGPKYVESLISFMSHPSIKNNQTILVNLVRILAALVYGDQEKMEILIDYFRPIFNFNKFNFAHTPEMHEKFRIFCDLCNGIEKKPIGNTLKDYILDLEVVKEALDYITLHAPCVLPTLWRTDSDELKEFLSKPALKYILKFLTGMAHSHENTQLAIASTIDTIPIVHRLEQVSSDEHVGSLAENLLEALCTNPSVAKLIERVREFTRSEKKRLAMAMREKQLGQLGMRTNDRGQVTAKSTILQQIEMELGEESGLVCCICREGYKYQPTKVLGIYTFTKRCNVEYYEGKPRKTVGYSTVTHFNIVHIDCHMSAIRLARARDEWESAALQNANTKCNGLLPLWGPQVPESAFASSLARHNTYLQESTSHRDIGHVSTVHDLKLLLLRFAQEKSFHEDSGGGGPQSNMFMVPYLIHVALYVINTTRVAKREEASLAAYLSSASTERWIESAYECEGPLYWAAMSLLLHSHQQWSQHRVAHLRRLIVIAHARSCQPGPCKTLLNKTPKEYAVYKPYLMFFALIDGIYKYFFKNVPTCTDEQWPATLADYIRHNDETLIKASDKLLEMYTDHLLPCESFEEFWDVGELVYTITDPNNYIADLLAGLS